MAKHSQNWYDSNVKTTNPGIELSCSEYPSPVQVLNNEVKSKCQTVP